MVLKSQYTSVKKTAIIMAGMALWLIWSSCHAGSAYDGFRVESGRLYDANGNEFVMRGVNMPHVWFPGKSYEALDVAAQYNTNCIRIVWESDLPVDDLEQVVKKCIDLKMVPMIELHDATGDSAASRLLELARYFIREDMQALLKKYQRFVLVNIANEWGNHHTGAEYWQEAYKACINEIRASGYEGVLVIDAPGWGQNIEPVLTYGQALLDHDPQHNVLFSVHMYGSWNDPAVISDQLRQVRQMNLPVLVGEFGYDYNQGENNLGCRVDHMQILKACEKLGLGYLAWSWTGNNKANAWLDLVDSGDWETLSPWGMSVYHSENGIVNTGRRATVFD